MGVPLNAILGAKNIIGIIQKIKAGLQKDILPGEFFGVTEQKPGNYGTYHQVVGERRVAAVTNYGGPAMVYEATGVSEIPVNFIHSLQSFNLTPAAYMNLLAEGDESRQNLGLQTLGRQTGDFAQTFVNLRTAAMFQMLAQGKLMFDSQGRMTQASASATRTVDYAIPAQNKGQLAIPRYNTAGKVVASPIVSASWATVGTDIMTQVNTLQEAAVAMTGYPIRHAFCGRNIKSYIVNNTTFQTYLKFNTPANAAVLNNEIPKGFLGLEWHEMKTAYVPSEATQDGSSLSLTKMVPVFDPDTITFTPDVGEWYDLIEGSYPIPYGEEKGENAVELVSRMKEVYGHFGYAKRGIDTNPSVIVEFQGDTFLPVIRVPYSLFIAKVANF